MSDQFVTIPETTLPGGLVVPAFRVGRYVCTKDKTGKAAVTAEGTPWVNVSFTEAKAACHRAGYALITESQALALAYHIAAQDANWTGSKVGKGKLYQGLRKWTVRSAQPGTFKPTDPDEQRQFFVTGKDSIFDAAGNVFTWVFDDVQGDKNGLIAKAFAKDSPSLVIPYPAEDKGQGWLPQAGSDWSGGALIRGGCWDSGANAGAFYLGSGWPGYRVGDVGFRCTTQPGL
ncbi:MAG: hypothetical protein WCV99_13400 [Sterolibacterium sp.]|jgi:formylglycine-generating enzyme required for sulfatase activity